MRNGHNGGQRSITADVPLGPRPPPGWCYSFPCYPCELPFPRESGGPGATNAAAGLKVPAALEGALLPNGTKITRSTIRGVDSFGMLCAGAELGLEESSQGLMVLEAKAKPGTLITKYLQLDDHQLEIELTPNRGDCLSIMGLARELVAHRAGRVLRGLHLLARRRRRGAQRRSGRSSRE